MLRDSGFLLPGVGREAVVSNGNRYIVGGEWVGLWLMMMMMMMMMIFFE